MRAQEFLEDNFGTNPKRKPRAGSRHPRGHTPVPGYRSQSDQQGHQITPPDPSGVLESHEDTDNFTIADIKSLERIEDFATLKARAKQLIKGKPVRRMKPEKIAYFYDKIDTLTSPMKVIKLMYDLLLAGEGMKTIGSRHSMNPNTYQRRFGESDAAG